MTTTPEHTDPATARVVVRYWAAAKAAAGTDGEELAGSTVAEVLAAAVSAHPELAPVVEVATVLVEGRSAGPETALTPGAQVEVLPPFAGG